MRLNIEDYRGENNYERELVANLHLETSEGDGIWEWSGDSFNDPVNADRTLAGLVANLKRGCHPEVHLVRIYDKSAHEVVTLVTRSGGWAF